MRMQLLAFDRTVTNLLGEKLAIFSSDSFSINGESAGSEESVMVANGTRVFYQISRVLSPPTK
jgi:hypothetical protein